MKICRKCGAVQDDMKSTCIDCGELLPSVPTDEDKKAMQKQLDILSDKSEGVYFPLWVKLVTLANFLMLAGVVLYCYFEKINDIELVFMHTISCIASVLIVTEDKLKKLVSSWFGGWLFIYMMNRAVIHSGIRLTAELYQKRWSLYFSLVR